LLPAEKAAFALDLISSTCRYINEIVHREENVTWDAMNENDGDDIDEKIYNLDSNI